MARIPRQFVPLDMNYLRDPAIRRAGPEAELLYLRGLAHSKAGETEGFIGNYDLPVVAVALKRPEVLAAALVHQGLWLVEDDGWRIRSWEKWNLTRTERDAEKQKKRDAAILTNHKKYHVQGRRESGCPHCQQRLGVAS